MIGQLGAGGQRNPYREAVAVPDSGNGEVYGARRLGVGVRSSTKSNPAGGRYNLVPTPKARASTLKIEY